MMLYGKGMPRIGMLLTDNGLEFNGIQLNEFLSRFNTVKRNTSPYHPEMNGKCERVHALVDLNMAKLLNDNSAIDIVTAKPDCGCDQAMDWNPPHHHHHHPPHPTQTFNCQYLSHFSTN